MATQEINSICPDCKQKHYFTPSLKERGITTKEAKELFLDPRGGRCSCCYIKHRNKKASLLMVDITKKQKEQTFILGRDALDSAAKNQ